MKGNYQLFDGLTEVAAGAPDENGVPKFEEQKLRRYLENTKLGSPNKIKYAQSERKFHTCPRYNPCPICDKCMNKASHLYVACKTCWIPICNHSHEDKKTMIKRRNFKAVVSEEIMELIKKIDIQVTGNLD